MPTVLSGQVGGGDLVVGIVVGSALGFGLLAVPSAVPWLLHGRGTAVLRCCGVLLALAGPVCVVGNGVPAPIVLVAALVFGAGRASAAFVLLSEVGRLGPDSPGQGYNSAAQRLGSAAGGLLAGWAIASEREEVAAAFLAVAALALTCGAGAGAVRADRSGAWARGGVRASWATTWGCVTRDRGVQGSLLLNVTVWVGVFVSSTMLPVALLQLGVGREEVGERVLLSLVARDLVAVAVGVLAWRALRRIPVPLLVLAVGLANAVAALVLVADGFSTRSLWVASVLAGAAVAVGISCANVVATRGPVGDIEPRLAASQALAGIPIALLAVALVALLDPLGGSGAVLANGVLAVAIAALAAAACAHDERVGRRRQSREESADIATQT